MFEHVEAGIGTAPAAGAAAMDPGGRWDAFARAHGRVIRRCVVRAMVRSGWPPRVDELEELVQEVYCRLLERGDTRAVEGRPAPQLWCYLRRVAYSVVVDELRVRHARKRGGRPAPTARPARREDERPGLDDGPAVESRLEDRILARERVRAVRRRVREAFPGRLGERNLRVLELSAVAGMTANEIAAHLRGELSPSSVHTVLHRVRRLLAPLADAGGEAAAG